MKNQIKIQSTQKKPLFIVFDGIDGNGKTTQVELLKKYLEEKGFEIFLTSEPSNSEFGKKIENLLRRKQSSRIKKEKWLELFSEDRKENVKNIKKALEDNKIVISDRYYYSTLAYQLPEERWQSYIKDFLKPDLTFILDIDIETAINRIEKKYEKTGEKKSVFEKIKFLKETRKKFLLIPNFLPNHLKIIDSKRTKEEVFEDIKKEINLLIKN